jgi:hypothetical protein
MSKGSKRRVEDVRKIVENWQLIDWSNKKSKKVEKPLDKSEKILHNQNDEKSDKL